MLCCPRYRKRSPTFEILIAPQFRFHLEFVWHVDDHMQSLAEGAAHCLEVAQGGRQVQNVTHLLCSNVRVKEDAMHRPILRSSESTPQRQRPNRASGFPSSRASCCSLLMLARP